MLVGQGDSILIFGSKQKLDIDNEVERMINDYGEIVLKTAFMYLKDIHWAEDAFQEVFIKVYKNYRNFRGESSEKTWIIRITINVCRDFLKSFWSTKVIQDNEIIISFAENNVESEVIENVGNRELFHQVLNLPVVYKEVILLYYYHGFNTVEISKIFKISEGTVRSRLSRGREILKKYVIKENSSDE